jgi:REP element-mobilizing transposase RayT
LIYPTKSKKNTHISTKIAIYRAIFANKLQDCALFIQKLGVLGNNLQLYSPNYVPSLYFSPKRVVYFLGFYHFCTSSKRMIQKVSTSANPKGSEFRHSMKRRPSWHDYSRKGTYMLTLVVRERRPLLGTLKGALEGAVSPYVEYSELGNILVQEEQRKIHRYYPQLEVWKLCIMPDHLHMIVRISEDMGEGKHLGKVVAGFKSGCNHAYWKLFHWNEPPRQGLFEEGYCDKILLHDGQLDNWMKYLDDNPRRLLIKQQNPAFFTVLTNKQIACESCWVAGNSFLLDIPDKVAVIVHRRYTDEEIAQLRKEWLECGERGGVLVSAAISPKEKTILREAMNRGYRIILLRENGFPKLYKPAGEAFDACAQGLLLQISPWEFHFDKRVITRAQCLHLNALAERIAEGR